MVTGCGPQLKVMMPPLATAATTADEVQLAAVPLPITRAGFEVSTARAAAGTAAFPCAFPAVKLDVVGLDVGAAVTFDVELAPTGLSVEVGTAGEPGAVQADNKPTAAITIASFRPESLAMARTVVRPQGSAIASGQASR